MVHPFAPAPETPAGPLASEGGSVATSASISNALATACLPVIVSRDSFVFPGLIGTLHVVRESSRGALQAALDGPRRVLLLVQRDPAVDVPGQGEIHLFGTVCETVHRNLLPDGTTRVVLKGLHRAWVRWLRFEPRAIWADPETLVEFEPSGPQVLAAQRLLVESFAALVARDARIPEEALDAVEAATTLGLATDAVAHHLPLATNERQASLEERNPLCRAEWLLAAIGRETELLDLEDSLRRRTESRISDEQRALILREKLRTIHAELGDEDGDSEIKSLRRQVEASGLPPEARAAAAPELLRLERGPDDSAEAAGARTYVETLLAMPWAVRAPLRDDLDEVRRRLDAGHAGLAELKRRALEIAAIARRGGGGAFAPLLLVGPPGVGKTSAARAIADALGLPFASVALGGVKDEGEIRGHRRAYIGAGLGRLAGGLRRAGVNNPLILLDEIDKLDASGGGTGAAAAALLEALDPEQAPRFLDHYLGVPVDLSGALFVATANAPEAIPAALRDRFETVELPSYSPGERAAIARGHLWPEALAGAGLDPETSLRDDALHTLVTCYSREPGVRDLRRKLGTVARRLALDACPGGVTPETVHDWFGPCDGADETPASAAPGTTRALMVSARGGEVVTIEAALIRGGEAGRLTITGLVGPAMQESARAALAALRASGGWPAGAEVHLHAGEAGVPKDGPSAGLPCALSLASAASGKALRPDVASTGEIGLAGDVRPIGGLREKLLAASRAGMRVALVPFGNAGEAERLRPELEGLTVHAVATVAEALALAQSP